MGDIIQLTALNFSTFSNLTELNVQNVKTLVQLNCSNTAITALNLTGLTNLESLTCSNTSLTSLDLTGPTQFKALYLDENAKLSSVKSVSTDWITTCELTSDDHTKFYLIDGTELSRGGEVSIDINIDGATKTTIWKEINVGGFVLNPYGNYLTFSHISTACPAGYRAPTKDELEALTANYSDWTTFNGVEGRWFSGGHPFSDTVPAIFLPKSNWNSQIRGTYWSSDEANDGQAYYLFFDKASITFNTAGPNYHVPLRCIKD